MKSAINNLFQRCISYCVQQNSLKERTYMMKNNYNYRITLTPVDKFFFGGDMTFQVGSDEKDLFNTQYSSYIIESKLIPQQTSLLGMLRFLILRNNDNVFKGNKIIKEKKAEDLIGSKSFTVNESHDENSFGKIKSISHVRICRDNIELEFAPLYGNIDFSDSCEGSYNFGTVSVPNLSSQQYNAKDGLETLLMPLSDFKKYFKDFEKIMTERKEEKKKDPPKLQTPPYQIKDIFVEDRRIGIARNIKTGRTDDGALFKQISYRFNNKEAKHCFVFDVEVEGVNLKDYNGQLVTVGGDNSQFIIGISEYISRQDDTTSASALSLLSPAFLTREDVKNNTCFAITQLMPFRFLTDRKDNDDGDNRSYHILNSRLERSPRYELFTPGSVFYFENNDQRQNFITALNKKKEFRQIGYNEYKLI